MKLWLLYLYLTLAAPFAFGQSPPSLLPVDDITKLANSANRTIEKSPYQKNLVPEQTPSGMTVYRELPPKLPRTAPAQAPATTGLTPEEAKQFREAEERGRLRRLEQSRRPPPPPESPPATAWLSGLYNIEGYCKEVGAAVGGSYRIEQACRDRERQAFAQLENMTIAPEIGRYCAQVGKAVGGSYRIMLACVNRETEAKKNLR